MYWVISDGSKARDRQVTRKRLRVRKHSSRRKWTWRSDARRGP